MDPLLLRANRALGHGDPLTALKLLALRDDATALALRGIALAQLSDYARAKRLLTRAERAFGPRWPLQRARCRLALAEIALATRDLRACNQPLDAALRTLQAHGDRQNALHAQLLAARRALWLGRVGEAERALAHVDLTHARALHRTIAALSEAEIALRGVRTARARAALTAARRSAQRAGIPALVAETDELARTLRVPAARYIQANQSRTLTLAEVERTLARRDAFIIDACRRAVHGGGTRLTLQRRPVLFTLLRELGQHWPAVVPREQLMRQAFGTVRGNASHRVRLRVELARLRKLLGPSAAIIAQGEGFRLELHGAQTAFVLAPPVEGEDQAVLALLSDGSAWSSSALALALGVSQRTVQRVLADLEASRRVRSLGRARAQRWLSAGAENATHMLLRGSTGPV